MLMPAAVLVMIVLGGLAVDSAVGFLAARELSDLTAAAANDAASEALDDRAFHEGTVDGVTLHPRRAEEVVALSIAARGSGSFTLTGVDVDVTGEEVTVRASATVRMLFAPALPGTPNERTVTAVSRAEARLDG